MSQIFRSILRRLAIPNNLSTWPFIVVCNGGAFTTCSEIIWQNGFNRFRAHRLHYCNKKFSSMRMIAAFTSTRDFDVIRWTIANLENLSVQVRKYLLSLEKMSTCRYSPANDGIGVSGIICFLEWQLYMPYKQYKQTLQFATTSFTGFVIFWNK